MKPDSMAQATRDVVAAFLCTFLFLLGLDFLIPGNSRIGRKLRGSDDQQDV
jgi:hypothetical protein